MRVCKTCQQEFPLEQFYQNGTGRRGDCKKCHLVKTGQRTKANRQGKYDYINEYKTTKGCLVCGNREPVVLDLHHHLGDKEKGISEMIVQCRPLEAIQRELEKCVVLCANDHRMVHAGLITI